VERRPIWDAGGPTLPPGLATKQKTRHLVIVMVLLVLRVSLGMSLTGNTPENPPPPPTETQEPGQPINNVSEEEG